MKINRAKKRSIMRSLRPSNPFRFASLVCSRQHASRGRTNSMGKKVRNKPQASMSPEALKLPHILTSKLGCHSETRSSNSETTFQSVAVTLGRSRAASCSLSQSAEPSSQSSLDCASPLPHSDSSALFTSVDAGVADPGFAGWVRLLDDRRTCREAPCTLQI
jgi:hypothetical protein